MRSAEEFVEFLTNSTYSGQVGLVVKLTMYPGTECEFDELFGETMKISVKEKGCIKTGIPK